MFKTNSEEKTKELAAALAKDLKPGDVLALVGELGSGKTCFVKGLARGLDVPKEILVTSPTFVLIHEYWGGRLPLFHFDFYRLEEEKEARHLNLEDYWDGNGVSVIEWADKFKDVFPKRTRWIHFKFIGEKEREVKC